MQENMPAVGMTCKCTCHKLGPLLIVLIGLVFLLGALNVFSAMFVAIAWPILLILIGLHKLFKHSCGCCHNKMMMK